MIYLPEGCNASIPNGPCISVLELQTPGVTYRYWWFTGNRCVCQKWVQRYSKPAQGNFRSSVSRRRSRTGGTSDRSDRSVQVGSPLGAPDLSVADFQDMFVRSLR